MAIPKRFAKGNTPDEKFNNIETTLRHFSRRLQKVGTIIIPPIPIFAQADLLKPDGIIFRGLIPYKGKLNTGAVWIGKFNTRPVVVNFKLSNTEGEVGITINCDRPFSRRDLGMDISIPSILEISMNPHDGAEDILVSVLTEVELSSTYREQILLDAILSSYEMSEDIEEITPDE